jgi:hypothetical protein
MLRAALPIAALAIAGAAHAQASASSESDISYSFSFDPLSVGSQTDMTFQVDGNETYNLVNFAFNPYAVATGTGYADTYLDPSTNFDPSSWSGYAHVASDAGVAGFPGSGKGSIGNQENLEFLLDANALGPVMIDITATGFASASVSAVPNATA